MRELTERKRVRAGALIPCGFAARSAHMLLIKQETARSLIKPCSACLLMQLSYKENQFPNGSPTSSIRDDDILQFPLLDGLTGHCSGELQSNAPKTKCSLL